MVLNECVLLKSYTCIYKSFAFHFLKNINVKVRIMDKKITEKKLRRYTFKMKCFFATDSIRVQKWLL